MNSTTYKTKISEERKEQIIKDFLPFIKYTASRLSWRLPPQLTIDDLISVGIMGLLDALERYQEGIAKLNTFAELRIKGAMLDELRTNEWIPASMTKKITDIKKAHIELEKKLSRTPEDAEVAQYLNISIDEYYSILQNSDLKILRFEDLAETRQAEGNLDLTDCIPDPEAKSPFDLLEDKRKKEMLAVLISSLPEKEKLILSLYYWEELTMKEIAEVLSITEGRVSQLHNQAITRLKAKLDKDITIQTKDIKTNLR